MIVKITVSASHSVAVDVRGTTFTRTESDVNSFFGGLSVSVKNEEQESTVKVDKSIIPRYQSIEQS